MNRTNRNLDGIILMGPFGSGKSYLGRLLHSEGIAQFTELESIVYDLFSNESGPDIDRATKYIRAHYFDTLSSNRGLVAFESTGVVQRPLLLDVLEKYQIALIQICTPKKHVWNGLHNVIWQASIPLSYQKQMNSTITGQKKLRRPTILLLKLLVLMGKLQFKPLRHLQVVLNLLKNGKDIEQH